MKENKKHFLYRYSRYTKLIFLLSDIILVNSAFIISFYIRYGDLNRLYTNESQTVFLLANIVWLTLVFYIDEYKFIRIEHVEKILAKSIKIVFLHLVLIFTIISVLNYDNVSRLRMLYFYGLFFIGIFFFRIFAIQILKYIRKKGYNFRNVIIVGAGKVGQEICSILRSDLSYGYRVLGFFDDEHPKYLESAGVLGAVTEVKMFLILNPVHEVYMALPDYDSEVIGDITNYCEGNLIRVKFIPDFRKYTKTKKVQIDFYDNIPVISLRKEPLEIPLNRIIKKIFDVFFSLIVIIFIFTWLFPILMILVTLSSKGPIFFKQQRSGENNRMFYCLKFRTMKVNSLSDELQATKNDNRITKIGRFLRRTNLDELPQFFNVLLGDMSIVGPRPHMLKHTKEYSELINTFLVRHLIRPGITGWAQVNGFRGETINIEQMKKRVEYDIWYIENWAFLLDLKIIFNTIIKMFKGDEKAV
jgi:putative colanic acid biosynthesis UDP-glucose lipid carrier transferase